MSARRTHYQLQSTRGFAACVEPTEENHEKFKLTDDRGEVDCQRCLRWMLDRDRFVKKARARQEHGAQTSAEPVRGGAV
jgi:hypothetical protein